MAAPTARAVSGLAPTNTAHASTADALRLAAFACLMALAPAMVVAHRSSVLTVTLAACLAGAAATLEGHAAALGRNLRQAVSGPTGAAALAFLLFGLATIGWSPRPAASLRVLGEFVLPIAACLVLAATLPGRLPRAAPILVAGSLALAAALLIGDLASGLAARHWAGLRAQSFVLNRPALTLLVLLPAAPLSERKIAARRSSA